MERKTFFNYNDVKEIENAVNHYECDLICLSEAIHGNALVGWYMAVRVKYGVLWLRIFRKRMKAQEHQKRRVCIAVSRNDAKMLWYACRNYAEYCTARWPSLKEDNKNMAGYAKKFERIYKSF